MKFVFKLLWSGCSLIVHTLISSSVQSYFSFLLFVVVFVCMHACVHKHMHTDMSVFPPCDIISLILRALSGSCTKITNRMLPYSFPLLLNHISLLPSFPSIVQGGASGLINMFTHIYTAHCQTFGGLDALEAWIILKHRVGFYYWSLSRQDWNNPDWRWITLTNCIILGQGDVSAVEIFLLNPTFNIWAGPFHFLLHSNRIRKVVKIACPKSKMWPCQSSRPTGKHWNLLLSFAPQLKFHSL